MLLIAAPMMGRPELVTAGTAGVFGAAAASARALPEDLARLHGLGALLAHRLHLDIGNAVAYFASDLSRFVTGQTWCADGGYTSVSNAASCAESPKALMP